MKASTLLPVVPNKLANSNMKYKKQKQQQKKQFFYFEKFFLLSAADKNGESMK